VKRKPLYETLSRLRGPPRAPGHLPRWACPGETWMTNHIVEICGMQ
jgi:hypothetical protein